ncbi:hypothetical protein ACFYO0_37995 [Streptomyces sp. NPDC006365]|uniref:hypothetical protein n=1 Tax=Streptomyces sp. NPDC006365 TaxID=3364744 RepID=UPI0036AD424E
MAGFLVFAVCGVLSGVFAAAWANWRERPLKRGPGAGEAIGIRARLSGDGKHWPIRPVNGDLWIPGGRDGPLYFVAGGRTPLAMARGGRVLDAAPHPAGAFAQGRFAAEETVVTYAPPGGAGGTLRLRVPETAVPVVATALTGARSGRDTAQTSAVTTTPMPSGPMPSGPVPLHEAFRVSPRRRLRVPRAAALFLVVALALGLFGLHTFVLGEQVTAEMTGKRDGVCSVRWQDPWGGGTQDAGVDCHDGERAGEPMRISARPWPLRGEAADLHESPYVLVLALTVTGAAGLLAAVAASVGAAVRLRALRRHLRDVRTGRDPESREPSAARRAVELVPWWAGAAGALGLAGAGLLLCAYGIGTTVRATVTDTEEYTCEVTWPDPWDGTRQSAEVDCDDQETEAGRSLEITALSWPLRGEAFDQNVTPWVLGLGTAVSLATAGVGVTVRSVPRRRRDARTGAEITTVPVRLGKTPAEPPATGPADTPAPGARARPDDVLHRAHLAAVAGLLGSRLTKPPRPARPAPDISTAAWWRSPRLRGLALSSGIAWGAMIVLCLTVVLSGWWWVSAVRLWGAGTATARATVEYHYDDFPLSPWLVPGDAEITFRTADGRKVTTDIVHSRSGLREDDEVTVEYAVDAPSAARIPGDPGSTRGLLLSGGAAVLALARILWRALTVTRHARGLLAAARGAEARTVEYVLLADPEDPTSAAPQLVCFDEGQDRPFGFLELDPGARGRPLVSWLPREGTAALRSVPGDPDTVVPWIGGHPVWPYSPLFDLSDPGEAEDFREYVDMLAPSWIELPAGGRTG